MVSIAGLEIVRLKGSGGFADVYEAVESGLERRVAVKVFRSRLDQNDRRSFEREAKASGRLSGIRNIVHVYASGVSDDDHPYLVMELMDGSIADRVGRGAMPVAEVVDAGCRLGEALAAAHRLGVLHRDIKPENILVDRYGAPRLSDFGIASIVDAGASSSVYAFTAEHAAPEVFDQPRTSPAADVYSLGSTLFTMIEGHAPFRREPEEGPLTFMRRVQGSERPSSTAAARASTELDDLLVRCLSTDPEERPTPDELVASLRRIEVELAQPHRLDGGEVLPGPTENSSIDIHAVPRGPTGAGNTSTPSRLRLIHVLPLALVVAGGVVWWSWGGGNTTERDATTKSAVTTTTLEPRVAFLAPAGVAEVGKPDMDGYCASVGYSEFKLLYAVQGVNAAFDNWICMGDERYVEVDFQEACRIAHPDVPGVVPRVTDPDDAYNWACYPPP